MFDTARLGEAGRDALAAGVNTGPAITASSLVLAGIQVDAWLLILSATFVLLQILYLAWKWRREARAGVQEDRDRG